MVPLSRGVSSSQGDWVMVLLRSWGFWKWWIPKSPPWLKKPPCMSEYVLQHTCFAVYQTNPQYLWVFQITQITEHQDFCDHVPSKSWDQIDATFKGMRSSVLLLLTMQIAPRVSAPCRTSWAASAVVVSLFGESGCPVAPTAIKVVVSEKQETKRFEMKM